jgi:hypothetical protein
LKHSKDIKMSLSKSFTIRIASQVYPAWITRALAKAEPEAMLSLSQTASGKQNLPPLHFSASFQTLLSNQDTTSSNWAFKPPFSQQPNYQQIRTVACRQVRTL